MKRTLYVEKIAIKKNSSLNHLKTRSMSLRISEDIVEAFETNAKKNNINHNMLLTQIIKHHAGYDGNVGSAGLVAFPRSLLVKLMDGCSEEKIISMADYISKDVMTDTMAILKNEYTVESFLDVIESWARVSHIPFRHKVKGALNTCVIQHNMGKNWSLYLGHLYKNVIEELTHRKVSITTSNNTVRFMF
jgi:hypothetical protein